MRLLIAFEKHGQRYFCVPTDQELHEVSVRLMQERIDEGWYEDKKFLARAKKAVEKPYMGTAWGLLCSRNDAEYERVDLEETESILGRSLNMTLML